MAVQVGTAGFLRHTGLGKVAVTRPECLMLSPEKEVEEKDTVEM